MILRQFVLFDYNQNIYAFLSFYHKKFGIFSSTLVVFNKTARLIMISWLGPNSTIFLC